ncbi:MAG: hypothetical protein V4444_06315 [Pseudomonadota bacterium]
MQHAAGSKNEERSHQHDHRLQYYRQAIEAAGSKSTKTKLKASEEQRWNDAEHENQP